MVIRRALCAAVLAAILSGSPAVADDLTTKDGTIYKNYKVVKTDSDGITIEYTGTVTIPFDSLPDDIQKKYGHDPNALSAEQAAEKARIDAETQAATQAEAALDEQDRQAEPELTRIKTKAAADYAAAAKVNLSGQIFIAAQDGETVDFSGIHVGLIPMELINRRLPQMESRVTAETRLLQPRIARAQKAEDQALKERSDAVATDRFNAALDRESQTRDLLDTLIEHRDYFTGGAYDADALAPWTVAMVTTDLGGKFTLAVPSKSDFVVVANVKSVKGTAVRRYFWFVKIRPPYNSGAFILLDSENQSSSGSGDSILKNLIFGTDNQDTTSGG